jgi:hypothetical protein
LLTNSEFVRQSLELNLFFMRIAKEHAIFMEAAFLQRDTSFINQSETLKKVFTNLLRETVDMSHGIISHEVAASGELVTDLTRSAEKETEYYTDIKIDSSITNSELDLASSADLPITPALVNKVAHLNYKAFNAVNNLIHFKSRVLQDVLDCKMFTTNYPLLLDHILREAHFYRTMLIRIQNRREANLERDAVFQEVFWNRIMAEHSKFIRGLLDPTEEKLFDTANSFGAEFDKLTLEAQQLTNDLSLFPKVTDETLKATVNIRNFKKQGTEGLIDCKIKSIAFPLLGDHVVREANHYIRLLKSFKNMQ